MHIEAEEGRGHGAKSPRHSPPSLLSLPPLLGPFRQSTIN